MLRHSLNTNFDERKKKNSKIEIENNKRAKTYIQSLKFHKRLRNGFKAMKSIRKNKKTILFEKPAKNRIDMDNITKAEICCDKSSDWITTRQDKGYQREGYQ